MVYTKTEADAIQKVISVFSAYIKQSPCLDLVLSDKIGYVLLDIDLKDRSIDMEPTVVESAEMLCEKLFHEIALDALEPTKFARSMDETTPSERADVIKRQEPYAAKLPEYRHLLENQFKPKGK